MLKVRTKDGEAIPWPEFKERLHNDDKFDDKLQFTVVLPKVTDSKVKEISQEEYERLVNPLSRQQSELAQIRADWQIVRRDTIWLTNALFAVLGAAGFTFFATLSFDLAVRIGLTAFVATVLFIIEVILYILRN